MNRRDKLAGVWHVADFILATIGLAGWLYWATHHSPGVTQR